MPREGQRDSNRKIVTSDARAIASALEEEEAGFTRGPGASKRDALIRSQLPRERITPVYAEDGRVDHYLIEREPEWDADQVDVLLASRESEKVSSTGHPIDEATDPRANPARADGDYLYVPGKPIIDWSERARQQGIERYKADHPQADMRSVIIPVERRERRPQPAPR